jgi:hypothetical protein
MGDEARGSARTMISQVNRQNYRSTFATTTVSAISVTQAKDALDGLGNFMRCDKI